jgi:hypothetical protein
MLRAQAVEHRAACTADADHGVGHHLKPTDSAVRA